MSLASIETTVENDVITLITAFKTGAAWLINEAEVAWSWVEGHIGDINGAFQEILRGVQGAEAAGLTISPALQSAIADAQSTLAATTTLVNDSKSGATVPQIIQDGYAAAKQLQITVGQAGLAVSGLVPIAPAVPGISSTPTNPASTSSTAS